MSSGYWLSGLHAKSFTREHKVIFAMQRQKHAVNQVDPRQICLITISSYQLLQLTSL